MLTIELDKAGDALVVLSSEVMLESPLREKLGLHRGCGGVFRAWAISVQHSAMACSECGRLHVIDHGVDRVNTYQKLLNFFIRKCRKSSAA